MINNVPLSEAQRSIVIDAKALGTQAVSDAKTSAALILTHIATEATDALPVLAEGSVDTLMDFVPGKFRGAIQAAVALLVQPSFPKMEADAAAKIKLGLGIALARIDALL